MTCPGAKLEVVAELLPHCAPRGSSRSSRGTLHQNQEQTRVAQAEQPWGSIRHDVFTARLGAHREVGL
jgi:hypothetical protein